ncbi:ribose-5-phosphate isomerase isoform X2 [Planococcus citri]|uniref:ribose-5-phosphate isomerase isoform X2 n=1 Tax=Planococcus citri TaxID=170843 RepID=UPI0031F9C04A
MASEINKEDLEKGKKYAAEAAIKDRQFKGKMVIGIGSGSTVVYAVEYIANTLKALKSSGENNDLEVVFVPSSYQARQLIEEHNLTLAEVNSVSKIQWTIDGADEVAKEDNLLIKGGGGCLTQEKVLAWMSNELYIIADYTKASDKLGQSWKKGIPIEVLSFCYSAVKREIEEKFGGETVLRIGVKKAGPVITDNGNFILDWKFPEDINDWKNVEVTIKMMPGVVEVGLFFKMANAVYLGKPDGGVEKLEYSAR